jgi:hypothetical protein
MPWQSHSALNDLTRLQPSRVLSKLSGTIRPWVSRKSIYPSVTYIFLPEDARILLRRNAADLGTTKRKHTLIPSIPYLLILGSFQGLQTPCPNVMTPLFRNSVSVSIMPIKLVAESLQFCIMRSFIILTFDQMPLSWQNQRRWNGMSM